MEAEVARLLEAERPAGDGVRPMLTKARWSTRIVDCQRRRGIPRERQFTPHGLRRRFCSNLLDAGCPIGLYVDQAGHSPRVALSVYYRATDRRRQALQVEVAGMTSGVDLSAVIAELGSLPGRRSCGCGRSDLQRECHRELAIDPLHADISGAPQRCRSLKCPRACSCRSTSAPPRWRR